jgi:hexulose-6-phosphate isomerase
MRNGRIQSFPWNTWQEEFETASKMSLRKIEWTIDTEDFNLNPLLTFSGRQEILQLKSLFNMEIPSITCDYFMENPPWKSDAREILVGIESILSGMVKIDSRILVVPLVDNSSLGASVKTSYVVDFFKPITNLLRENGLKIAFETDLSPGSFLEFIENFDADIYGINYDIGNSASFGFDPTEEFSAFGSRIVNVHIKDRALGGTTVPLGTGNVDFPIVFRCLHKNGYVGNLIMQTARARDGRHTEALTTYRDQILNWMGEVR